MAYALCLQFDDGDSDGDGDGDGKALDYWCVWRPAAAGAAGRGRSGGDDGLCCSVFRSGRLGFRVRVESGRPDGRPFSFLLLLLLLLLCCWSFNLVTGSLARPHSAAARASSPPHIVFILIDDLGSNDLGFIGHQIKTPVIDSLAKDGLFFSQYYVQSTCSPTRSAIMTGRYPLRTGAGAEPRALLFSHDDV